MDPQQQYADAMRAFDAYYDTRRRVFGADWPQRRYAEHRSWKVFLKVAERCAKAGRDPARFVEIALEYSTKNGDQVVPQDLLGKGAETAWGEHSKDRKVGVDGKWAYYVRTLMQIQQTDIRSDEDILVSAMFPQFPAWFRVFYPETLDAKIVEAWGESALEELRAERDIVRFLRAAMPAKVEAFERTLGVTDGL